MSTKQAVEQLKKSESLWSQAEAKGPYDRDKAGWQILVEKLVWKIQFTHPKPESLAAYIESWQDKKLLAVKGKLSDSQTEELRAKGFKLCPERFLGLGMKEASTQLDFVMQEKRVANIDLGAQAAKDGIVVASKAIEVDSVVTLMSWFKRELSPYIDSVKILTDKTIRVNFKNLDIPKEALASILFDPKNKEQQALVAIRSFILKGISSSYPSWFAAETENAPTTVVNGVRSTYNVFYDQFQGAQLSIVNDVVNGDGCYLEFNPRMNSTEDLAKSANAEPLPEKSEKIKVSSEYLENCFSPKALLEWMNHKLSNVITNAAVGPDGYLVIHLDDKVTITQEDLNSVLYRPSTPEQKTLHSIRSFLCAGLSNASLSLPDAETSVTSIFGGVTTTYSLDREGQLEAVNEKSGQIGNYIKVKVGSRALSEFKAFFKLMNYSESSALLAKQGPDNSSFDLSELSLPSRLIRSPLFQKTVTATLALTAAVGGYFSLTKDSSADNNNKNSTSAPPPATLVQQDPTIVAKVVEPTKTQLKTEVLRESIVSKPKEVEAKKPLKRPEPLLTESEQKINDNIKIQEPQRPKVNVTEIPNTIKSAPRVEQVRLDKVSDEFKRWNRESRPDTNSRPFVSTQNGTSVDGLVSQRSAESRSFARTDVRSDPVLAKLKQQNLETSRAVDQFAPNGHLVLNFKIVDRPTSDQTRKLQLLSEYLLLTTGVRTTSKLFVFQGQGLYGINIDKTAIGLHEQILTPISPFTRALDTFIHEVAHNAAGFGHEEEWRQALETLQGDTKATLFGILDKQRRGSLLSEKDRRILELIDSWHSRR